MESQGLGDSIEKFTKATGIKRLADKIPGGCGCQKRKEALELLVQTISDDAERMGKKYIYALIKNKPLINVYKKQGFKEGSSYTHELIKTI